MEVSTQPNSSISTFGCYSNFQGGSSFSEDQFDSSCFEKYQYQDDFMTYDDFSSTGESQISSAFDADSEESKSEDEEPMDEDEKSSELRQLAKSDAIELVASTEMLRIRFPFQSISIRLADFFCLQEKDLLNDTIVDFYLNHVVEHILPDEPNKRVTVLPSVFWHNLSILQGGQTDECDGLTTDQKLDARFGDVLDFVEDFDLMDVDYIVVPVNEWEHWSLAIVCHPFTSQARTVCFDSQLTDDHNNLQNIAIIIDEFLKYVWLRRHCSVWTEPLRCIVPARLPQQENNYDCGLFIVEFARRFLLAPPKDLDIFDFSAEYRDFSVVNKRCDMQRAVLSLCSNREMWTPLLQLLNARN